MTYLRCRVGRRYGCPWKINDETYDSEGHRLEHEHECASFIAPYAAARKIEMERLQVNTRARKELFRPYRISKRAELRRLVGSAA